MIRLSNFLKEKLGYTIYRIVFFFIPILPYIMIGKSIWFYILATIVIMFFPILNAPLWIWGFVAAVNGKQDIFAIIYYIVFFLIVVIPLFFDIVDIISNIFRRRY